MILRPDIYFGFRRLDALLTPSSQVWVSRRTVRATTYRRYGCLAFAPRLARVGQAGCTNVTEFAQPAAA